MKIQDMHTIQILALAIQHPSTFYEYQDTVELQEIPLKAMMDIGLAQRIKTMMQHVILTVQSVTKVPGGTFTAIIQTSMVSTIPQSSVLG